MHVKLKGHLTAKQLTLDLATTVPELENTAGKLPLIVDCLEMVGYDLGARTAFVEYNRQWRAKISCVAIVTPNTLWHMVISAMALASRQNMKAFAKIEDALRWASSYH